LIKWLPENDTSLIFQPQCAQLLVAFHKHRGKKLYMSIDMPFPKKNQKSIKKPKNIVKEALKFKSLLVKIVETLPKDFIINLNETEDQNLISRFSGKRLLKIASLKSEKNRLETIKLLMHRKNIPNIPF